MSDAAAEGMSAEKTPAEIELEDTMRSIRGFRENADSVDARETTASTVQETDADE
jgi:hypothetical protein